MNSLPSHAILREVLLSFIKENFRNDTFHIDMIIDQFLDVEMKAFEIMYNKISSICAIYKEFLIKVMDYRTERNTLYTVYISI